MNKLLKSFLLNCLISFLLICLGGWIYAHYTIAPECKKLGRFYIGDEVFHCKQIAETDHDNQ